MADVVQKEISFPIIPESINEETRNYLLRMQEILREVSLGASYLSAVTLQEFSADGAGFLDEDDMASDSDKAVNSEQGTKAYIDAQIALFDGDVPTNLDSESNAMLKAHAYLTQTAGYVTAWTETQNSAWLRGYVHTTDDPAGAGVNVHSNAGVNAWPGVSFFVGNGKYFEITHINQTPTIIWTPQIVGGAAPIDQD